MRCSDGSWGVGGGCICGRFYLGFCKQQLWPIFHYQLPLTPEHDGRFNRTLWQAYVSANKIFADKVMEIISPEEDYVWVHDYHLMVLPTFLRKRFNKVRLGFFLHRYTDSPMHTYTCARTRSCTYVYCDTHV